MRVADVCGLRPPAPRPRRRRDRLRSVVSGCAPGAGAGTTRTADAGGGADGELRRVVDEAADADDAAELRRRV
jgi:hypothetical protein